MKRPRGLPNKSPSTVADKLCLCRNEEAEYLDNQSYHQREVQTVERVLQGSILYSCSHFQRCILMPPAPTPSRSPQGADLLLVRNDTEWRPDAGTAGGCRPLRRPTALALAVQQTNHVDRLPFAWLHNDPACHLQVLREP